LLVQGSSGCKCAGSCHLYFKLILKQNVKNVRKLRSHAFLPYYTPVYSICAAETERSFDWDVQNFQLTMYICCMELKDFKEAVIEHTPKKLVL